ncbi:hypothetical protein FHETE_3778 [Fusarium heterosporum]|uniref:Uncharacterized protein n=1 Tax=Fusarium heterosporum TaxID=42747 RepID=A0A8H5THG2_FUSHE|nr:hypothetical protein FHETE_3778 [Fusarium heterosporum]
MSSLTKVVHGKVVTNTNVDPPAGWSVSYDDFGGDSVWGDDGDVADLVGAYGIEGVVKPLFRSPPGDDQVIFIIEINEQYYIYGGENEWVQRIITPTDLEEIVEVVNEKGYFCLETEEIG